MSAAQAAKGSVTRLVDIVFPGDANHHGTLFGGAGLAHMDKLAFIVASRHGHVDFVTASCERIDFKAPAHIGEIVELSGRVTRVGMRSLAVEVALVAEAPLSGERRLCARGAFNMVAVGEGVERICGRLPPLAPATEDEDDALRMTELVFPGDTSHYGSLYGGVALAAMGRAAFVAATRHCRKAVVMASSRRVDFESQVATGEIVELVARIVATGRSSMTAEIDLFAESLRSGERRRCARGAFVMVAVDARQRPVGLGASAA
ncbi:acyl-CoA thioesterase [Methylocella sp.]|uniref:acyl-CoA thioesterase n=1 Tax=Methylocella sp. TaxID=1978226 RepID=UPI003784C8CE